MDMQNNINNNQNLMVDNPHDIKKSWFKSKTFVIKFIIHIFIIAIFSSIIATNILNINNLKKENRLLMSDIKRWQNKYNTVFNDFNKYKQKIQAQNDKVISIFNGLNSDAQSLVEYTYKRLNEVGYDPNVTFETISQCLIELKEKYYELMIRYLDMPQLNINETITKQQHDVILSVVKVYNELTNLQAYFNSLNLYGFDDKAKKFKSELAHLENILKTLKTSKM